jgi:hypothetical protein
MTDRDTFAAAALTGLLASNPYDHAMTYVEYANESYRMADAMLRERNGAVDARETVCPHVRGTVTQHCSLNFTLTDEEREAIYRAEARLRTAYVPDDQTAATLRSLLERLRSTPQTHPTLS